MISSASRKLEPTQTKSLAFMMAHEDILLKRFINLAKDKLQDGKVSTEAFRISRSDHFEVFAESFVRNQCNECARRADIVIRNLGADECVRWAVVIEAKSINVQISNPQGLTGQLMGYCRTLKEQWGGCAILPVVLTENINYSLGGEVIPVTWQEVVNLIVDSDKSVRAAGDSFRTRLYSEFVKFITGANKMTQMFEEEVLSIPAGKTYSAVEKTGVYACTDDAQHRYRKSLFITFRPRGGVMSELYKLAAVYVIPYDGTGANVRGFNIPEEHKDLICAYISEFGHYHTSDVGLNVKFHVLDRAQKIVLPHLAHSSTQAGTSETYYNLADMLDPVRASKLRPASSYR